MVFVRILNLATLLDLLSVFGPDFCYADLAENADKAGAAALGGIEKKVGPAVVEAMRGRLGLILSRDSWLKEADYLDVVDGIFAMHPGAFKHTMELLFRLDFETNQTVREEARNVLEVNGVVRP